MRNDSPEIAVVDDELAALQAADSKLRAYEQVQAGSDDGELLIRGSGLNAALFDATRVVAGSAMDFDRLREDFLRDGEVRKLDAGLEGIHSDAIGLKKLAETLGKEIETFEREMPGVLQTMRDLSIRRSDLVSERAAEIERGRIVELLANLIRGKLADKLVIPSVASALGRRDLVHSSALAAMRLDEGRENPAGAYPVKEIHVLNSDVSLDVDAQNAMFKTGDILRVSRRTDDLYGRLLHFDGLHGRNIYASPFDMEKGIIGAPISFRGSGANHLKRELKWGEYNPADMNFYPERPERPGVRLTLRNVVELVPNMRRLFVGEVGELSGHPLEERASEGVVSMYSSYNNRNHEIIIGADEIDALDLPGQKFRVGDLVYSTRGNSTIYNSDGRDNNGGFGIVLGYEAYHDGNTNIVWVLTTVKKGINRAKAGRAKYWYGSYRAELVKAASWGEYDISEYNVDTSDLTRLAWY